MLRFSKITISAEVNQINELNCSGCNAEVAVKFVTYALIMNKETNFMRLKNLKKNRLSKDYVLYELNFDNVRIFTKKTCIVDSY